MQVVNKNSQCFIVWSSEVEGRFDPHFYKIEFRNQVKELLKTKFKIVELKDVCTKISDGTHFTPKYVDKGIPFLSVKDIRENQINFEGVKFISEEEHKILTKRCKPEPNDILLTKVGTVGISAVIPENTPEFSIFVSVALLKINKLKVNPYYVSTYLNSKYTKTQIDRILKGIGVPDLHLENIAEIKIPLPPIEVQNEIISLIQSAYSQKVEKKQEAEKLLNSIDNYVLEELGIKIPEVKDTMCFVVDSGNVNNNRTDAIYWKPKFQNIEKILKSSQFPIKGLTEIAKIQRGILIPPEKYKKGSKNYIRISDLKNLSISPENIMKVDFDGKEGKVFENEILFTAIGATIGKIALIDVQFSSSYFSNNLTKIIAIKVNPKYLASFILSKIGQEQIKRYSTQTAQPKINDEELAMIKISLPPTKIQNKIANEVKSRIEKAKLLKSEAENIIESAKKQVEKIILGK
jgi:restriction endonuclease S subunit